MIDVEILNRESATLNPELLQIKRPYESRHFFRLSQASTCFYTDSASELISYDTFRMQDEELEKALSPFFICTLCLNDGTYNALSLGDVILLLPTKYKVSMWKELFPKHNQFLFISSNDFIKMCTLVREDLILACHQTLSSDHLIALWCLKSQFPIPRSINDFSLEYPQHVLDRVIAQEEITEEELDSFKNYLQNGSLAVKRAEVSQTVEQSQSVLQLMDDIGETYLLRGLNPKSKRLYFEENVLLEYQVVPR